jgi:photosystem II stability/assembly factor-like uncharacterized protein
MDGFAVSAILIDPDNHNMLTATLGHGKNYWAYVWRSTDGGQTWNIAIQIWAPWNGLSCSAKDKTGIRHYYATAPFVDNNGVSFGAQVYRSDDRGATWTALPLPFGNSNSEIKVAASPNFPDTVYLLDGFDSKIWVSANGGETWTDISSGFNTAETIPGGANVSYDWSQAWYDKHIECGTGQNTQGAIQDVLFVGLIDLSGSTDGGKTWSSLGGPTYNFNNNSLLHNDQHALMINPNNPFECLVGCDGGVYRLNLSATGNPTYTSLNANLGITEFYTGDFHPTDPTTMIGGTQDNAAPTALADLSTWLNEAGGDGAGCGINPLNPAIQYGTTQYYGTGGGGGEGYIYRTADSWNSVSYPQVNFGSDTIAFVSPLTLDPTTPTKVYAASNYLYRYHDNTNSWDTRLGNRQLAGSGNYVQCITVAPSDGNRIYTGSVDGQVWMTTNGGTTWTQINTVSGPNTPLPSLAIQSIAVSSTNSSSILVGLSGSGSPHLWACTNTLAGANLTWNSISGTGVNALPDASLNTVAIDIDDPAHTLYVGTDLGVFQTLDGGNTWQNATNPLGLPNVQVNVLKAVPGTRYLQAATYGRGMWRIKLDTAILSVTLNPTILVGGTPGTGTVTLSDPAPQGGFPVTLASSNATVAAPTAATITIPAGATSANFNITSHSVTAYTPITITAGANGISRTAPLVVAPKGNPTFTLNPTTVIGGVANSTGTITVPGAAPTGGISIALSSSDPAAASVPSSVTIPAGATSVTFTVTSHHVSTTVNVGITASSNGISGTVTLTVQP